MEKQTYLGDVAYAREGLYKGEVIIYCSNGIEQTETIAVDQSMLELLSRFNKQLQESYK